MEDFSNCIPLEFFANNPSEVYSGKYGVCKINGTYKLFTRVIDRRTSTGFRVKSVVQSDNFNRFSELVKNYLNLIK